MSEPLCQIWRRAENAALSGADPDSLDQVDAICDSARITALRDWLFPDGMPPQPWSVAEYGIWQQLTAEAEAERCRAGL